MLHLKLWASTPEIDKNINSITNAYQQDLKNKNF